MREKWARRIVLLTALLVVLLAILFASVQNPSNVADTAIREKPRPTAASTPSVAVDPQRIAAGRKIYQQQHCAGCHAIGGEGNPRNLLDGVGAKHTAAELRDFIIGADILQGVLPDSIRNMKQGYRELPSDDLDALVNYLQSLR